MPTGLGDEQLWLCPSLDNATPFNDLSSQGNNGTAQGGLSTITDTGAGGAYAYNLNGTNNYIDVSSSGVPASAYTVSLWQYSTNSGINTAFNAGQVGGERTVNIDGVRAGLSGDNHGHKRGSTSYWVGNPTVRTSATWYHYLLTYDGSELRLYVDGIYTANKTGVPNTDWIEDRCWIGQYIGGSYFFQGRIDDIRTYGRVLTQSERGHLATARGIEGRPFDGLGDEQLWLCPSLENSPNDISGNNNNGVYQNGMGTITDTSEGGSLAYDFDGNNDYVSNSSLDLRNLSEMSWSAWIYDTKPTSPISAMFSFGKSGTSSYPDDIHFFQKGSAEVQLNNGQDGSAFSLNSSWKNSWHHFAVVFDGAGSGNSGRLRLFVDGLPEGMTYFFTVPATTSAISPFETFIGAYTGLPSGNYFQGRQDDVRVYKRALTQSEVSWLATERGVLGTPPEGLGDEQLWLCPSIQDSPNDISGNNNNGVYQNGMGTIADTAEGGSLAYDFDGVGDYIDITGYANSKTAYSLSTWINGTGPNQTVVAFNVGDSSGSRSLNLGLQPSAIALAGHQVSPSYYWAESTSTVNGAGWKHVAATYDGSDVKIYVDGVLEDTQAAPNSTTAQTRAFIGRWVGSTPFWLTGKMDDIRAYNRVLTQSEISWLSTERGVLGTPPEGLGDEYGWWCPSLDASADGLTNLTGSADATLKLAGQFGVVSDTGSGGTKAWEGTGLGNSGINTGVVPLADNDFSMSCWFKQDAGASGFQEIMAVEDPSTRDYLQCRVSNGAISTDFNGLTMSEPTDLRGGWHHVVVTLDYSGNAASQYIDGVLVNSGTMSNGWSQNLGEWEIGSQGRSGTLVWDGLLDDSRIYNRVLTQSEITHLASQRGVLGAPALPTGLGGEKLWLCPSIDNSPDDLSGNGNNGTYVGGMGTITSNGKLAYDFDGANDYITYPISAIDSANSIGSVSAWVKTGSTANPGGHIIGGSDTASTNAWSHLRLDSGEPTVVTYSSGQVGEKQSSTNVNDSNWHHVCAVGDGSNHSIYIDGTLASSTWMGTNYGNRWIGYPAGMGTGLVGALVRSTGAGNFFNGKLDDIRSYNRVLTQAEISWLATERGVLGTPPEGLGDEQLWLCPSIQDSANDISANNNHGTYVGGAGTISDVAEGGTRSYEFTNSSHYVTGTTDLDTTDDFSLSYWYRSNTGNSFGTNYHIFRARNGTRGFNFYKYYSSGTQTYTGTTICRGGASSNSSTPVNYGIATSDWLDWHCFTMNWDNASSTMEYFIDGVSVGTWNASVSGSVDATGTTMILGALGNGTGTANGYIDDLRKYSRKLTQAEITHLASQRGVLGAPALPTGLGGEKLWLCPSIDDSPNDISGNGNNGTYVGGMGTVTSGGKLCYDFDGSNDYIDLNDQWNFVGNYSYSLWINKDSGGSVQVIGNRDTNADGWLTYINISGVLSTYNDTTVNAGPTISNSTWYCITVTYDGTNLSVYKNGVLDSFVAASQQTASTRNAEIGRYTSGTIYNGQVDDIRFYDRALTQAEISWLATERGVLGTPPEGLGDEQLWLCPSIQDSANDLSGNGNNGSYQNGTATVADTDATYGGTRAYFSNAQSQSVLVSNFGDSLNDTTSISMWVKSVNPWVCVPVANGSLGYSTSIWQYALFNSGTSRLLWRRSANLTLSGATPSNQWQHIVIIRDNGSSTQEVYVDGVLNVTSASFTNTYGTNQTWFGFGNAIGTNEELYMDDMRTYGRVLTQAEITHLATSRGVLGSPNNCGIITDLTYWSDLDDGLSSTLADDNGGSDVLTRNGGATDATGSPRSSACVDYGTTVTNYHSLNGGANQPAPPSDYSFSIWAKCTGSGSTGAWIANQRLAGATSGWNIFRRSSNGLVNFSELAGGSAVRQVEVTLMSLNTWYLLSFSRNNSGLYAYVNGSLVGSDTTSMTQGTDAAPLRIGTAAWNPTHPSTKYNGYLWSCGMWDRVLTASEHSQLYQSGQGLLYSEICPTATTQYNAFVTHAFRQLFQTRLR